MDLIYKKETIKNAQMFFIDKLSLACDMQVVGDCARLARVPNTYHSIAGRFCIPLTEQQFDMGDDTIKKMAVRQNFVKDVFIGEELFDLAAHDIKNESRFDVDVGEIKSNGNVKLKNLPGCITSFLDNPNANYKERYLSIIFLKEKGYTKDEIFGILKSHLTKRKFWHCINEERQLEYLFSRDDLVFPSCEKIEFDGFCPGKCKFYNKCIYS